MAIGLPVSIEDARVSASLIAHVRRGAERGHENDTTVFGQEWFGVSVRARRHGRVRWLVPIGLAGQPPNWMD